MEQALDSKLSCWRRLGEAPEYYALRNRGPYKPLVVHEHNRFGGQMGPYADSLLPLSFYINASPIDNLGEGAPVFVATMCPKRSTFAHFWSMVWETGSRLIVNLTHERDKVGSEPADKREQYWPPFDEATTREARGWAVGVRVLGCEACMQVPGLVRYAIELLGPPDVGGVAGAAAPAQSRARRVVALYWYSRWLDFPASSSIGTRPFFTNAWHVLHVAMHLGDVLGHTLGPDHVWNRVVQARAETRHARA